MPSRPSGFYVYMLVDPKTGIAFYVGKGQGNRAWQHAAAVARGDTSGNARKIAKIQEILTRGDEVEIQIVAEYDLEDDALEHEFELVDSIPTLTNAVPGGGHGPGGCRLTAEHIRERIKARQERIKERARQSFLKSKARGRKTEWEKAINIPNAHLHQHALEAWFQRQESEAPRSSAVGFVRGKRGPRGYNLAASHKRRHGVSEFVKEGWEEQKQAAANWDREVINQHQPLSDRQKEILAEGPGVMGHKSSKR